MHFHNLCCCVNTALKTSCDDDVIQSPQHISTVVDSIEFKHHRVTGPSIPHSHGVNVTKLLTNLFTQLLYLELTPVPTAKHAL